MDINAESMFGIGSQGPSWGQAAPTQRMAGDQLTSPSWRSLVDPKNPLVWFGLLLLGTVGVIGVAGSVRVGRAKVEASVGE